MVELPKLDVDIQVNSLIHPHNLYTLGSKESPEPYISLLNSRHRISGWSEMSVPSLCRLAGQKVATLKAEHVGHIFTYAGKVPDFLLLGLGPMKGRKVG